MGNIKKIVIFVFIGFLYLLEAEGNTIFERARYKITFSDGSVFVFSSIGPKRENYYIREHLLELRNGQLWVYRIRMPKEGNREDDTFWAQFYCLSTKESLTIEEKGWSKDIVEREITLAADCNKNEIVFQGSKIKKDCEAFHTFVQKNFSSDFIKGLTELKDIACKEQLPAFMYISFIPLTGMNYLEKVKESAYTNGSKIELISVDCDFDAKFGYPCKEDEKVSPENNKIMIRELK